MSAGIVTACLVLALAFVALAIQLVTRAGRTRAWTRVLSNGATPCLRRMCVVIAALVATGPPSVPATDFHAPD